MTSFESFVIRNLRTDVQRAHHETSWRRKEISTKFTSAEYAEAIHCVVQAVSLSWSTKPIRRTKQFRQNFYCVCRHSAFSVHDYFAVVFVARVYLEFGCSASKHRENVYSWTNGCSHIQTVKPSIVKRSPSTRANASVYVCVVCRWSDECISGPERDRYTAHKSAGSHNSLSSCCFHFHASHEFGRMVCVCDGSPSLLPAQPTDVHDVLTQVLRIHWLREFSSVSITRNNSPVPMSQRAPMGRPVIDIYIQS